MLFESPSESLIAYFITKKPTSLPPQNPRQGLDHGLLPVLALGGSLPWAQNPSDYGPSSWLAPIRCPPAATDLRSLSFWRSCLAPSPTYFALRATPRRRADSHPSELHDQSGLPTHLHMKPRRVPPGGSPKKKSLFKSKSSFSGAWFSKVKLVGSKPIIFAQKLKSPARMGPRQVLFIKEWATEWDLIWIIFLPISWIISCPPEGADFPKILNK